MIFHVSVTWNKADSWYGENMAKDITKIGENTATIQLN